MTAPVLLLKFTFQLNIINHNGAIRRAFAVDALHAVVAYFVRVQVTAVALAAICAYAVLQDALLWHCHGSITLRLGL